jgi:four helix bundle protein
MASVLKDKSYAFAIDIVKLYQKLCTDKKEFVLSKQLLRSGTAIGALIAEAIYAQSKADFISKLNIALKEAHETEYRLCLLKDTGILGQSIFDDLDKKIKEILKILIASIKTARTNNN